MSLLNQVLQDLEKRNAEDTKSQNYPSNIKAVTTTQKKFYYLPLALICIPGLIAIYLFNSQDKGSMESHTVGKQNRALITLKQPVTAQTPKKIIANLQQKKKPVAEMLASEQQTSKPTQDKTKALTDKKRLVTQTQSFKPEPRIDKKKAHAVKKLSNKQKADQLFKNAEQLQSYNNKQNTLEQALNYYPQHNNARFLLANTLLYQGLTDKAVNVLDQGLKLFPENLNFINLRSQLFLQKKQAQAAIATMLKLDANYVLDETYLSLLAAAYQQNNDSFNSLRIYQKLLKINSEKAEYWLGLAIALEKQNQPQQALDAYQQTLKKNTLKPVIISYIKQRISLLK